MLYSVDSVPFYGARDTIALLANLTSQFIGPDLWPPNSPELNPVDLQAL